MTLEYLSQNKAFGGDQFVLSHQSEATGTEMTFSVYVPPHAEGAKLPVRTLVCQYDDVSVVQFGDLDQLRYLEVTNSNIDERLSLEVSQLKQLEYLQLTEVKSITGKAVRTLQHPKLKHLEIDLRNADVQADDLLALADCPTRTCATG